MLDRLFDGGRGQMDLQSISIGYGKETFATSSVTLAGFVVESPFIRTLASKKLQKVGSSIRIPVSNHPDIDGWLYQDTVMAPEGTICMVQMQYKYRGSGLRDGAIIIRTRTQGSGLMINALLPHDPRSILSSSSHCVFSGYGDILNTDEIALAGIEVPKNFKNAFMNPEEVEECYDVQVLREPICAAPTIEEAITPTGEKVHLRIERAPRRMRIRREGK